MAGFDLATTIFESAKSITNLYHYAIVIVLIGFIIGKILGRISFKILNELELDYFARKLFKQKIKLTKILSSIITSITYIITLVIALRITGLINITLYFLGGIILVIFILSLILGIKDIIPNAIAGHLMLKGKVIKKDKKTSKEYLFWWLKIFGIMFVSIELLSFIVLVSIKGTPKNYEFKAF